jgi:hypothetical protein
MALSFPCLSVSRRERDNAFSITGKYLQPCGDALTFAAMKRSCGTAGGFRDLSVIHT